MTDTTITAPAVPETVPAAPVAAAPAPATPGLSDAAAAAKAALRAKLTGGKKATVVTPAKAEVKEAPKAVAPEVAKPAATLATNVVASAPVEATPATEAAPVAFEPAVVTEPKAKAKRAKKEPKEKVAKAPKAPKVPKEKKVKVEGEAKPAPHTGQSAPKYEVTLDMLNANEKTVLLALGTKGHVTEMTLTDLSVASFPDVQAVKANSWVRNAMRKLTCGSLVEKMGRGTYKHTETGRAMAKKAAKVAE